MSTDKSYFEHQDGAPPYEPTRKKRGCMFYGCLASVIVSILAIILIGVVFVMVFRMFSKLVEEYGEDMPQAISIAEMPEAELKALRDRFTVFQEQLVADKPTEPIILTAQQINALIDSEPDLKGVVALDFVDDKIQGEVAFPLEKLGFPGKFINGKAMFRVRVEHGLLLVTIESLTVKGKPVGEEAMAQMRLQNLAKDFNTKEENIKIFSRIESVEVKDGKLIITPKLRPDAKGGETKAEDVKKNEPKPDPKKDAELKKDAEPAKKAA